MTTQINTPNFFEYWDTLGFFDNLQMTLPREFFLLFDIARLIASQENTSEATSAIEELSKQHLVEVYNKKNSIAINRLEKNTALSDKMEIQSYKTIYDLKKALPRELLWDRHIFNIKLFTKTLQVQKHFDSDTDKFINISPIKNDKGRNKTRFEQKFYLLLDRSRSMDNRMRSFYSKTIVVEFLRRKLNSNAKLFFRAFDSKPGSLMKIERKEDFPALIEKVLFTTTGGTSTNMQAAIYQAIEDIGYDKEMTDAEILVVTDGLVHDLEVDRMKEELKDIKLNILKIGLDLAEPNQYQIKQMLEEAGYDFDPFYVSIKDIKKKFQTDNGKEKIASLSNAEQRIYKYMLECSEKIIRDIKKISYRFIEINDINTSSLSEFSDESARFIEDAVKELLNTDLGNKTIQELAVIYKKAYFLSQYLEFLLKSGKDKNNPMLENAIKDLSSLKEEMLSNPNLFDIVMRTKGFEDDKKLLKSAKKAAKKNLKEMMQQNRNLTKDEIKNAQMAFSMGASGGDTGSIGLLFRILFIKLWELIKTAVKKILKLIKGDD
jgi:hypothetical protein